MDRDSDRKRVRGLDFLRTVAISLVVLGHLQPIPSTNEKLCSWGWIGVDIFFVLSGFLVSGLLFREWQASSRVHVTRFLIRRGFKIYPPLWVLVLVTVILEYVIDKRIRLDSAIHELIFLQNYAGGLWGHTWSLATEEHFYFLLALMVLGLCEASPQDQNPFGRRLICICTFFVASCLILRLLSSALLPFSHRHHYFPTHCRIDSLFIGVALSYLWHFHPKIAEQIRKYRILQIPIVLYGFGLPIVLGLEHWYVHTFGFLFLSIATSCVLLETIRIEFSSYLAPLCRIGEYSYSIYLWHLPLSTWIWRLLSPTTDWEWMIYAVVYVSSSFILGIAMAICIEQPCLKIRDRLFQPSPQLANSPNAA